MKTFGTSNLIDHLTKKHPVDFQHYEEKKKMLELTAKQSKEHGKKRLTLKDTHIQHWDVNDANMVRIHNKIVEMMVLNFQHLSTVSDVGSFDY